MEKGYSITIGGTVQGVGFRPFVCRLGRELGLNGFVRNTGDGVEVTAVGPEPKLNSFLERLRGDAPGMVDQLKLREGPASEMQGFEILPSRPSVLGSPLLPDTATCQDCLAELKDPSNRRHRWAFITCTHCGPRYTISHTPPYDRHNTSMADFTPCPECVREYQTPLDRRFHSQTNSCPQCGPRLQSTEDPATLLRKGGILALKGIGGFQLAVIASNQPAVHRLRQRKQRPEKPLAVMVPDVATARTLAEISRQEEALLRSPAAPIVILKARTALPGIAPGLRRIGLLLPTSPLHQLLLEEVGQPLVMTSGNLSDEPIATDNKEAQQRLGNIADGFLFHDRRIVHLADDSVTRVIGDRAVILRRARGYVPTPIRLPIGGEDVVAVGGQWKSVVGATVGNEAHLSAHIGDLETEKGFRLFMDHFHSLRERAPAKRVACDLHPEYASTTAAETSGLPLARLQHHEAHLLSCLVDNALEPPVLGVVWDGTGYGHDGTIWGSEFLYLDSAYRFRRLAHLRPFRLPGGDRAAVEPRRSALGWLAAAGLPLEMMRNQFSEAEWRLVCGQLREGLNAPLCTSMGRLFDAAAALLGICSRSSYEGQAAMALEDAAQPGTPAWRFHSALANWILEVARQTDCRRVLLTGGVFQNRLLTEMAIEALRGEGFEPFWQRQVPPNDGGLALGQLMGARI